MTDYSIKPFLYIHAEQSYAQRTLINPRSAYSIQQRSCYTAENYSKSEKYL
jgi:hypothetical protein